MKNKIYKRVLGIIASFMIVIGLSACSTPNTSNTPITQNIQNIPNTPGATNMSLNQNTMANSNMGPPQTRVS